MHLLTTASSPSEIICLTPDLCCRLHRFDAASAAFVEHDCFAITLPPDEDASGRAEVVAAASVVDTGSSVRELTVALRTHATASGGGFRYIVGVLDLRARCFESLLRCSVSAEDAADGTEHALADGPVLYLLSKRASQRESMEVGSLLGLRPPVNEGDEHGHVRSTGVVSVLCMLSWSGQPEETFALCLCEPDAGGARELVACGGAPAHTDETLDDPLPLIGGWNAHQASVGHRAPAAAALAPTIVCAASQRLAVCGDDGRAALVTQLWVGTSAAMLHCCGCDGQSTPLASLALSHVPRRMEPVPMQHGQLDGLAVLCASAGAVRSQLLLLSRQGDVLRTIDDVLGWHAAAFLGGALPQLLVRRSAFGIYVSCASGDVAYATVCARAGMAASVTSAAAGGGEHESRVCHLRGYALVSPYTTWAEVGSEEGTGAGAPAPTTAPLLVAAAGGAPGAARRRQLRSVAHALAGRLGAGLTALEKARSATVERRLLREHAISLLRAQAANSSDACAETYEELLSWRALACRTSPLLAVQAAGESEAGVGAVDEWSLARWSETAQLGPLARSPTDAAHGVRVTKAGPPLASERERARSEFGRPAPPAGSAVDEPVDGARSSMARHRAPCRAPAVSAARPRVIGVEHGFRQGHWLLRVCVRNDGQRAAMQLSCALVHPSLALQSEGAELRKLPPAALVHMTLAVRLSQILSPADLDVDLLLCWRAATTATAVAAAATAAAATPSAAFAPTRWHHRIGTRVRLRGGSLFDAALAPPPSLLSRRGSSAVLTLPPALQRSVHLVLEAPVASAALIQLPHALTTLLSLRPLYQIRNGPLAQLPGAEPGAGGMGPCALAAPSTWLACSESHALSDGTGTGTELLVGLTAAGRCAELRLCVRGAAHEAVLASVIGVLRAGLPSELRIEISMGAVPTLDCLRRASLALHAELAGAARACEEFLVVVGGGGGSGGGGGGGGGGGDVLTAGAGLAQAARAAQHLACEIATLQSASDELASVVASLV